MAIILDHISLNRARQNFQILPKYRKKSEPAYYPIHLKRIYDVINSQGIIEGETVLYKDTQYCLEPELIKVLEKQLSIKIKQNYQWYEKDRFIYIVSTINKYDLEFYILSTTNKRYLKFKVSYYNNFINQSRKLFRRLIFKQFSTFFKKRIYDLYNQIGACDSHTPIDGILAELFYTQSTKIEVDYWWKEAPDGSSK